MIKKTQLSRRHFLLSGLAVSLPALAKEEFADLIFTPLHSSALRAETPVVTTSQAPLQNRARKLVMIDPRRFIEGQHRDVRIIIVCINDVQCRAMGNALYIKAPFGPNCGVC